MNERLLVVLNKNKRAKSVDLELPAQFNAGTVIDIVEGRTISLDENKFTVDVGGMDWNIFIIE